MKANQILMEKGTKFFTPNTGEEYFIWFDTEKAASIYAKELGLNTPIVKGVLNQDVYIDDEDIPYSTRITKPSFVIRKVNNKKFLGTLFPYSSDYIQIQRSVSTSARRTAQIPVPVGEEPPIVFTQRDSLGLILKELSYEDAVSLCNSNKDIQRSCSGQYITKILEDKKLEIFPDEMFDVSQLQTRDGYLEADYVGMFTKSEAKDFLWFGRNNLIKLNKFAYLTAKSFFTPAYPAYMSTMDKNSLFSPNSTSTTFIPSEESLSIMEKAYTITCHIEVDRIKYIQIDIYVQHQLFKYTTIYVYDDLSDLRDLMPEGTAFSVKSINIATASMLTKFEISFATRDSYPSFIYIIQAIMSNMKKGYVSMKIVANGLTNYKTGQKPVDVLNL